MVFGQQLKQSATHNKGRQQLTLYSFSHEPTPPPPPPPPSPEAASPPPASAPAPPAVAGEEGGGSTFFPKPLAAMVVDGVVDANLTLLYRSDAALDAWYGGVSRGEQETESITLFRRKLNKWYQKTVKM